MLENEHCNWALFLRREIIDDDFLRTLSYPHSFAIYSLYSLSPLVKTVYHAALSESIFRLELFTTALFRCILVLVLFTAFLVVLESLDTYPIDLFFIFAMFVNTNSIRKCQCLVQRIMVWENDSALENSRRPS